LAYIPISTGCNNACSYCVVPFTRGPLICRHHKEILKEVKNLVQRGFKEIWLLGQNVNDYKSPLAKNNELNFPQLIKMVDKIPGDFKFFFTSPHPKNFSDELIDTLSKCKKFGKYLNLPVQSGDEEILKKMNRNYTPKEYKNLVKKIREKIPEIKLSTDVIVGFPGETEKQFQNTVKLFKEIKFDMAYIAKYSPRKRTTASRLKDNVPLGEKKQREKLLKSLLKKNKRLFK
jgi:tRNA-2-methylthio-N6-dimethylallyladenosine synthase